jgi:hypothetical protein
LGCPGCTISYFLDRQRSEKAEISMPSEGYM